MPSRNRALRNLICLAVATAALLLAPAACGGPDIDAAGIVAYTRIQGKVYVLLADHPGTGRGWGTFGGHREPGESAEDTAWREFTEETRCLYRDLVQAPGLPSVTRGTYRSYVLEVPYLPAQVFSSAPAPDGCDAPEYRERGPWIWLPLDVLTRVLTDGEADGAYEIPRAYLPEGARTTLWAVSAAVIRDTLAAGLLDAGR